MSDEKDSKKIPSERRRFVRIESLNLLSYSLCVDDKIESYGQMGRTLDVSLGGLLIQTNETFPIGTILEIKIGIKENIIRVLGRIVHSREVDEGLYDLGIEFVNVSDTDKKIISDLYKKC